jgi:hypothetical protein
MQTITIERLPTFPYLKIFSHGTVTAAGNITQNPVKQKRLLLLISTYRRAVVNRNFDGRIIGRVKVGHHECRGRKASRLVNEKMGPFGVGIVGYEQAGGNRRNVNCVVRMKGF